MAIRATAAAPRYTRALTFDDVPEHLRPSGFRYWLDRVPEHPDPDDVDHVQAAYGCDPGIEVAELIAHHAPRWPPVDPHWRTMVAVAEQWEAYYSWCAANGLTLDGVSPSSRAAVPREWSWTELRHWEEHR
ncbi:hypothetical protein GS463_25855 [Rhodococcus hoagii]|uniref:Uncharacterized protein n=1 Tax=Rhodococcus hoagii TaxID=43767 RepID=A0AAE2W9Q9_RHOHA|nr:hypothetical protein [Prescottella equi]MBM4542407.1 hypothetical protein [Prescottella equi]MBM4715830.1 hypothetical protein [Prescottella equi]NKS14011.1 hypothetical protein [Prescottella equi]